MKHYQRLTIKSIREEGANVRSFVLDDSDSKISYHAGQFLTFVIPGRVNEERRSYSISSAQDYGEPLTITVKRIDNGIFSRYLFDNCREGDALYTIGASGFFTLPENLDDVRVLVFFAAGSGITPILPLIKTAFLRNDQIQVVLIYSNSSRETAIFLNELEQLKARYGDRLRIEYLFSNAKNLMRARLSKSLAAEFIAPFPDAYFYLCGPADYMQMVMIVLLTEGVERDRIRREIFDTARPVVKELPPDQEQHRVIIRNGGNAELMVQYPETILAAAKRNGIELPYSCEAGKCGTCAATCVKGEVWMSNNEVLLDNEVKAGRVLTCTGYPVGGDVELIITDKILPKD